MPTFHQAFRTLRHWLLVSLGRLAAQVKLCRVSTGPDGRFCKRRRYLADLWVWPLNTALACFGIGLEVLKTSDWLAREQRILGSVMGRWVCTQNAILTTERLPGGCLWRYLRGAKPARRMLAVEAAARSLRKLHDAGETHSDAALHNAIYEEERDQVAWLDFETRYRPQLSEAWCQAHDIAAFLASAAKALPTEQLGALVVATERGYGFSERVRQAGQLLGTTPVLLIIETPWNLESLERLREIIAGCRTD